MSDISVIIPFYNRKPFLRSSVKSVLSQSVPQATVECLAIDDGSTDGSIDSISDLPVRILQMEENRGPSAARNLGMKEARGKFITFLDSDDLLTPDSLKWRFEWLSHHATEPLVAGRVAGEIDAEGNLLWRCGLNHDEEPESFEDLRSNGIKYFYGCGAQLFLFRKEFLQRLGDFDEALPPAEDWDFYLRILKKVSFKRVHRPVCYYRYHGGNISLSKNRIHGSPRQKALAMVVLMSHGLEGIWLKEGGGAAIDGDRAKRWFEFHEAANPDGGFAPPRNSSIEPIDCEKSD